MVGKNFEESPCGRSMICNSLEDLFWKKGHTPPLQKFDFVGSCESSYFYAYILWVHVKVMRFNVKPMIVQYTNYDSILLTRNDFLTMANPLQLTAFLPVMWSLKALTHYKDFHKDFSKKICRENRCPYIKLLKKSLQLWKNVVVCMDDNDLFCSFSCSVRGP